MCGIAGIFDVTKSKEFARVDLSRELLLAIEKRGRHATGYAYIENGATRIEKADVPAHDFVDLASMFTDGLDSAPRAILLHARYATQGSPAINENNHPIHSKISGMTLIHNGWLTNEKEILRKYRLQKDAQVDSETILRLIEHFVIKEKKRIVTAIKFAMRELEGVFACALISEKYPDTMWLWRSGYPISTFIDNRSGAFIFASTPELLIPALRNAEIMDGSIKDFPEFKVGVYTTRDGKLFSQFTNLKIRKPPEPKKRDDKQGKLKLQRSINARRRANDDDVKIDPVEFECPRCRRDLVSVGGLVALCQTCKTYRDVPNSDNPTAAAWEAWKEQGNKINDLEIASALVHSGEAKKTNKIH